MKYEKPELIKLTIGVRGESSIDACGGGSAADAGCGAGGVVTTGCIPGVQADVTYCTEGGNFD